MPAPLPALLMTLHRGSDRHGLANSDGKGPEAQGVHSSAAAESSIPFEVQSPVSEREKERYIDLDHLHPKLQRLERHSYYVAALVLLVLLNRVLISAHNLARFKELDSSCSTCFVEV